MKEAAQATTAVAKRILVVDDARNVAQTIKELLVHFGHQVDTSHDGDEALHRLAAGHYDLVITDYAMPKMNGIELARIIKQRKSRQQVLLVSGFLFSISASYAAPLPVDSILAKPFSLKQLQEAVETLLLAGGTAFAA
jgi:CheY-like chemotaxis protein